MFFSGVMTSFAFMTRNPNNQKKKKKKERKKDRKKEKEKKKKENKKDKKTNWCFQGVSPKTN